MNTSNPGLRNELSEIYARYGFELARTYESDQVLVFTIKTGYFDNADIVPICEDSKTGAAFKHFTDAGYACTIRKLQSPEKTEQDLFKGFFSVDSIVERQKSNYLKFTSGIVSHFSQDAEYEYINAPYRVNDKDGVLSPAEEVASRLDSIKPTLFLIEAAAGFGKTCSAYELVKILTDKGTYLPLFSELARNRQASIFRYILLDEIDRTFPVLSSRLVQSEMRNGRVITILDGFDELLRKNEDGTDFEKQEPMLETIGEFLTGRAKIVLTTRRTILFEGDAFHRWIDDHSEVFDFVRIRINEPRVTDWLGQDRLAKLRNNCLRIEELANPVLLSYLRCIPMSAFEEVAKDPGHIVERYFQFMLEREKIRQDLRMSVEEQELVLTSIADDMICFGYTSEQRDYIVDQILRSNSSIIDRCLRTYPPAERPSRDEVANKLASHALLDRSQSDQSKIAFVNEFVLGHFVSEIILASDEWLNDDMRFIEPAVVSYQPRQPGRREGLWKRLSSSLEYVSATDRVDISARLLSKIPFRLLNDEVQNIELNEVLVGEHQIENIQFNECTFRNCQFNRASLASVTFLNCKYFGCTLINAAPGGKIYVLGGFGDQDFIDALIESNAITDEPIDIPRSRLAERFVLEKFWPIGRETISHKHRPIKGVCANCGDLSQVDLSSAISELKRRGVLLVPNQSSFIEINFEKIVEIRDILGRGVANGQ